MILSALPLTAVNSFAYNVYTSGDWSYCILDDGTAEITKYTGSATNLVIPSTLNGYTVTSIDNYAFYDCTSLTSITIPDSVTSIGDFAFYDCTSLTDVYYSGSEDEWKKIGIELRNDCLLNATIHFNFEIPTESQSYNLLGREFEYNIDYYTSNISSYYYNPTLSNMLAALSQAVYDENGVKEAYKELGFDNVETYDYGEFNPATCPYAIGFKKSDYNDEFVCLISCRGTGSISDGIADINITTFDQGKHSGFYDPAKRILKTIVSVLGDEKVKNIKFVLTGHSRGAAVANLLAVELMEKGVSDTNIYDYNFACPDVAYQFYFEKYLNIYNLCNVYDVVPHLPGSTATRFLRTVQGLYWGKYGTTYWFKENATIDVLGNHSMKDVYLPFFDMQIAPNTSEKLLVEDELRTLNGKMASIFCPVDVIVVDKQGNELVSVINGEINYYNDSFGNVIAFTDGDGKVVYVNENVEFDIKLIGTDTGEMTYSISDYYLSTGEITDEKTFSNVKLENGKEMFSPVSNAESVGDVQLYVIDTDGRITYIIDTDGNESEIETLIGDVNIDGKITIADAKWVLQSVAKTRDLDEIQTAAADVNSDGKVTIADAKWILQVVADTRNL